MNLADPRQLATVLEAILLAAGKPLSLERLAELFDEHERPTPKLLREALSVLAGACLGRGFELSEVASGYRLQVRERFSPWVGRLWEERPQRYSRALLETLALIAYRQPITRGEIEEVRGVAVNSNIVRTLQERDWIRVVGYREVPGRPAMFATTRAFLDHFDLKSLDELPPLAVLRELEPQLPVEDLDPEVPADLQARADLARGEEAGGERPVEARGETSFRSLLAELDAMEQGLKSDFDDLLPVESAASEALAGDAPPVPRGD
ncbi:SMC-Scp complex subunit ScpB [Pseudomonas stutzeri]|nr:SMC-Scp complex subunit ScpB [Stutzerimonas stutzeri]